MTEDVQRLPARAQPALEGDGPCNPNVEPCTLVLQVAELLAAGADPAAPDARGRPAYALAPAGPDGQDARDAFRRARAAAGEGAADWAAAGVPEALTPEMEAAQAAKAVRRARLMQGLRGVFLLGNAGGCACCFPAVGGQRWQQRRSGPLTRSQGATPLAYADSGALPERTVRRCAQKLETARCFCPGGPFAERRTSACADLRGGLPSSAHAGNNVHRPSSRTVCRPQREAPGCTGSRRALPASAQVEKKARLRERERERKKRAAERKAAAEVEAGARAGAEVAAAAAAAAEQAGRCACGRSGACREGAGTLARHPLVRPCAGLRPARTAAVRAAWNLALWMLASCELQYGVVSEQLKST
jgi:hypothetical protein